jgi:hypothetical protein
MEMNEEEKIGDGLGRLFKASRHVTFGEFDKAKLRSQLTLPDGQAGSAPKDKFTLPSFFRLAYLPIVLVAAVLVVGRSSGGTLEGPAIGSSRNLEIPNTPEAASYKQLPPQPEAYGAVQNYHADDSSSVTPPKSVVDFSATTTNTMQ